MLLRMLRHGLVRLLRGSGSPRRRMDITGARNDCWIVREARGRVFESEDVGDGRRRVIAYTERRLAEVSSRRAARRQLAQLPPHLPPAALRVERMGLRHLIRACTTSALDLRLVTSTRGRADAPSDYAAIRFDDELEMDDARIAAMRCALEDAYVRLDESDVAHPYVVLLMRGEQRARGALAPSVVAPAVVPESSSQSGCDGSD